MKKLLKSIYKSIPFKQNVFLALRKFHLPERVFKHLHFNGIFQVHSRYSSFKIIHFGHQIENEIFWNGLYAGWEKKSIKVWEELVQHSEVILDIGANTGIYALCAASQKKTASIFAFEPVHRVYNRLVQNIGINSFQNVKSYELGLSNYTGEASIFDPGSEHVLSVSVNRDISEKGQSTKETEIKVSRLDDWINDENIHQIDLIKLDVEYHEPEVLEGFGEYLRKYAPSIVIEVLTEEIADKINSVIREIDYKIFDINEQDGISKLDKVEKSTHFNILLLSPNHSKIIEESLLYSF